MPTEKLRRVQFIDIEDKGVPLMGSYIVNGSKETVDCNL